MKALNAMRGNYGELMPEKHSVQDAGSKKPVICFPTLPPLTPMKRADAPVAFAMRECAALVNLLPEEYQIGVSEFDRKGRGIAVNWDLYAFGKNPSTKKMQYVVQIRTWEKRSANGWATNSKLYMVIEKAGRGVSIVGTLKDARKLNAAIRKSHNVYGVYLAALDSLKD